MKLSLKPKKATALGANAKDAWWYENKGSADIYTQVCCQNCGWPTTGKSRILYRAIYRAMQRAGFV